LITYVFSCGAPQLKRDSRGGFATPATPTMCKRSTEFGMTDDKMTRDKGDAQFFDSYANTYVLQKINAQF
jgi:hypothetical protein